MVHLDYFGRWCTLEQLYFEICLIPVEKEKNEFWPTKDGWRRGRQPLMVYSTFKDFAKCMN